MSLPLFPAEEPPRTTLQSLPAVWIQALNDPLVIKDLHATCRRVEQRADQECVYPPLSRLFQAFALVPPDQVRVVIVGQDPYHGAGQAQGLAFSVGHGVTPPPSLRNILKELGDDLGFPAGKRSDLSPWAHQGVLLLNSVLSVRAGAARSHRKLGWERFTDAVLGTLASTPAHKVFLLWGNDAVAKMPLVEGKGHTVLTAAHPSPLSAYRGFFGSRHFSKANAALVAHGRAPIDWRL